MFWNHKAPISAPISDLKESSLKAGSFFIIILKPLQSGLQNPDLRNVEILKY